MAETTTQIQTSAGGVTYRRTGSRVEVALILVGDKQRWQLPKGMINPQEPVETAAVREVREETGLTVELIQPIEQVQFWYFVKRDGKPVRIHKFVDFYLMRYIEGSTDDHDHEVSEARWFEIGEALSVITFESERHVLELARDQIAALTD